LILNPSRSRSLQKVRCRISPVGVDFASELISFEEGHAVLSLSGKLTANNLKYLQKELERLHNVKSLELDLSDLETVTMTGLNCLVFFKQRIGDSLSISLRSPKPMVLQELKDAELMDEFLLL
jgi:ABC-type transporter Mla MlaB component